jgi:hypothetical protein
LIVPVLERTKLFPFRAFIRTEPNVSNRSQELKESIRIANNANPSLLVSFFNPELFQVQIYSVFNAKSVNRV